MPRTEDAQTLKLLDDAANLATGFPDGETARQFVHAFFRNVSPAELLQRPPAPLAEAASTMWRFAATRTPGAAMIRILEGAETSVIEIVNDDMRFLVNSTTAALAGLGLDISLLVHPVLPIERDGNGGLLSFTNSAAPARESLMHIEIAGAIEASRHPVIIARLASVLAAIRAVVEDWPAMRATAQDLARTIRTSDDGTARPDAEEDAALLEWLDADNFLFLGSRHYTLDGPELAVITGSGHGLLRADEYQVFDGLRELTRTSPDVQAFLRGPQPVMISKSNRRSPIHRPLPLDTVLVKIFNPAGEVSGLQLLVGLFTSDFSIRHPSEIPVLRRKVRSCFERSGLDPNSRDGHLLQHILDTFPRDELFQIDEDQLYDTAIGILHLKQRPGLALFVLRDPFERFATCLVYLPRDRFNAEVGRRIAGILEAEFAGRISTETTHFEDATLARLHFVIATAAGQPAVSLPDVERKLTDALRSWNDRLSETLASQIGARAAQEQMRRYAGAFPPAYRDLSGADIAVADIGFIDAVLAGQKIAAKLTPGDDGALDLRIAHPGRPVALSDVLPVLEDLGVRVINEIPFEITPRGAASSVWVQNLELQARGAAITAADAARFEDAFQQIWLGTLESDGFNRLVLAAGLSAREVMVLRTYCKLLRQAGSLFSQAYMEDTASAHPAIAALLVRLFEARANPALSDADRTAQATAAQTEIHEALEHVENLDEDRILRSFLQLITKTLRTNYYQRGPDGLPKPYLSIKIASREIDLLPQPRPLVEIFVASPRMEGCHLRGGMVARGGIRWSDRREDFRTEVLGLMKAQMVKNAVIVPIGSKGGFVVKRPAEGGREAVMAEVIACYRTLMCGLLDLTDNIVNDQVVPPANVVRHDGDDTYLVVAADKGTATFSDIANGVARDYGFWLDDAFASGGSIGYDHKVMGITAKGAWEAVKRHFREIGTDIQRVDFTCVGVGDMAGDVFGNGMMLSRHTRLVAAFNHMHIFIDPNPDAAQSWQERVRLFRLPRSSWRDYNAALLSPGGEIYDRRAKSIELSPQARARFNITAESVTPAELIQTLLRMDVDLLWFGGIGTYVKAHTESQADAGDRANDALRINASEIRAKVVGEGANLAITQRARIEYALAGGRINTDAIDNSAGVDTSDHEVNIKIAVGDVIAAGLVAQADRTDFLASLTDDVEHLVLADNYLQTQALSIAQSKAASLLDNQAAMMRAMERRGRLDRAVEFLPDDDTIAQRGAANLGLTRPEMAVLLAYAKNNLYADLLGSDLPDAPEMRAELLGYFPERLRKLAPDILAGHRLRREIIATVIANVLINRIGPSYIEDTTTRTGRDPAAIARTFLIVREVFGLDAIWRDIEALDNRVPASTQTRLFQAVSTIVEQAARWFLLSGTSLAIAPAVAAFKPGVDALAATLTTLLPESERTVNAARVEAHVAAGVPPALAARVVVMNTLSTAMDIVQLSDNLHHDVLATGRAYFGVGVDFGLLLVRRQARLLPATTQWRRLAVDALIDDFYVQQREITQRLITAQTSSTAAVAGSPLQEVLAEITRTSPPDLAMLTVASRRIRTAGAAV